VSYQCEIFFFFSVTFHKTTTLPVRLQEGTLKLPPSKSHFKFAIWVGGGDSRTH
jgi:hypothetical protein